jgi:hypothetical protein
MPARAGNRSRKLTRDCFLASQLAEDRREALVAAWLNGFSRSTQSRTAGNDPVFSSAAEGIGSGST